MSHPHSPHLSPSSTRLPHRYGNKDSSGSNLYLLLKGEAGDPRRVDGMYSISEQPGQVQVVEVRLLYPNDVPTGLHKFFKLDSVSDFRVIIPGSTTATQDSPDKRFVDYSGKY